MKLTQMHVMFRQFSQQMGMQNVRAVLPEQIDLLLNTSISDIVNQILIENVNNTNDRIITDNSKIGQVNSLRTLYVVKEVQLVGTPVEGKNTTIYRGDTLTRTKRYIDKFSVPFNKIVDGDKDNTERAQSLDYDLLSLVDFSVSYGSCIGSSNRELVEQDPIDLTNINKYNHVSCNFETNYYPVRLIDDIYLADVLNDFVLAPVLRSPVATVHDLSVDLYFGKVKNNVFDNGLVPYQLRVGYIKKPAVVHYSEDMSIPNVDCDLPDHLHEDVVKHAVELWQMAVSSNMATEQARRQRAQQEQARNTNRGE